MAGARFETLDDYLASLDPARAATMTAIIDTVRTRFPHLTLKMSWNVPQLQHGKHYVMGFSAAKRHLSIAPWSAEVMRRFAERLAPYEPTDNLFRVPIGWQPDAHLLAELVEARLAECS